MSVSCPVAKTEKVEELFRQGYTYYGTLPKSESFKVTAQLKRWGFKVKVLPSNHAQNSHDIYTREW